MRAGLPFAEITLGLLLLARVAVRLTATIPTGLLPTFLGAVVSAWARGGRGPGPPAAGCPVLRG
jgi:hypothetical protein